MAVAAPSAGPRAQTGWSEGWIYALRTHWLYLTVLQNLKWRIVPSVFGISILLECRRSPFTLSSLAYGSLRRPLVPGRSSSHRHRLGNSVYDQPRC